MADINNEWIVLLGAKLKESAKDAIQEQLDKWNFYIKITDADVDKQVKGKIQNQLDSLGGHKINVSNIEFDSNLANKIQGKLDNVKGLNIDVNDISLSSNFIRNVQDQLNRLSFRLNIGGGNFNNPSGGGNNNSPVISSDIQDALDNVTSPKIGVTFDVSEKASADLNSAIRAEIEKLQNQNSTVVEVRYTTEALPTLKTDSQGNSYLEKIEQITGAVFKYKTETGEAITKTLRWGTVLDELSGQSFEGWIREVTTYNDKVEQLGKSTKDNKAKAYEEAHKALKKLYDLRIEFEKIDKPNQNETFYYNKVISNAEQEWKTAKANTSTPENWDYDKRIELEMAELAMQRRLQEAYNKTSVEKQKLDSIQYKIDTDAYLLDIAKIENTINTLKKTTQDVTINTNDLRQAYEKMVASSGDERIENEKIFQTLLVKTKNNLGIAQAEAKEYIDVFKKQKLSNDIKTWLEKNTAATKEAKKVLIDYLNEIENNEITPFKEKEMRAGLKTIENDMRAAGKLGKSLFQTIKDGAKSFIEWTIASASIMDLINLTKQLATNVYEIDTAMIELNKVSDETLNRLNQSLDKSISTAKKYGASVTDVINATSDWKRLGYDIDEAEYLAEVATIYKNVGDGIDIDSANESLVSTLQGFQLGVSDALNIVDQFNEVANNFPIDSAGIGEALQKSAASFYAANTDLSKSIALIATTNSVVQDPSTVGTMWKTVAMRIRGAKTELEAAGEDTDGMVESTAKLRELIQGMTGFDIMADKAGTQFKDIYDIILGIGEKWNELNDIDQAALLEALAGKRQGNALSAALNNVSMLKDAYETASNAAGSSMREQETYLTSLEAKTQQFEASVQSLSNTILSSDLLKFFVDLGTAGVSSIDSIIQKFGALSSITTLGAGVLSATGHGLTEHVTYHSSQAPFYKIA